jgi:transglycosylase-like protein
LRQFWHPASDSLFWPTVRRTAQRFAPALEVPDYFLEQLLAIEDKRYLVHPGVDPLAMGRAALANLRGDAAFEGASTITQQLYDARRELAGAPRPRSLGRKLYQAFWALRENARRSKLAVLREYLEIVYWGRDYHGLDQAAEGYCRTERQGLTPAQGFFLAERLASPNRVYLARLREQLRRDGLGQFFTGQAAQAELVALYDQHFGCGRALERLLSAGRPADQPTDGADSARQLRLAAPRRIWDRGWPLDLPVK